MITKNIVLLTIVTVLSLGASPSLAASVPASATAENSKQSNQQKLQLVVADAWARASMPPNKNSAVYMKINNQTDEDYVLIGASAIDVANNVELHKSFVDEKGVSRMTSLDNLVIPARSEVSFDAGGIHIMLLDLKNTLSAGQKISVDLKFKGKEPITIKAEVK